jgi:hypothetical protein
MSKLLVENYQLGLGAEQFRDTDGIAPNHLRRDLSRIIAGTEYDDLGAWDLAKQPFEIAVCRHQDEVVSGGVVQKCCGRRRGRARFEARFRTQGRIFLTTQPEVRTKRQPGGAVSLGLKRSIHGLDYSEEFAVLEGGRELSVTLDNASWADWDQQGRLVFAAEGKLMTGELTRDGEFIQQLLLDLNPSKLTALATPDWAANW